MLDAYVFDAYGTLFDVHAAIGRYRAAAGPDADRFSEVWRTKQLEYSWTLTLAGHYVDFSELTERALDFAFARFPSVDRGLRGKLLDAYLTLDAFPDVRKALTELKSRGAHLAILSNGTPAMLAAAIEAAAMRGLSTAFFRSMRCVVTSPAGRSTRRSPRRLASSRQTWGLSHPTDGMSWARCRSALKHFGSTARRP